MKSLIRVGVVVAMFALLISSALIWLSVVNASDQQEPDSTQMKLIQERVRVTVRGREQYEFLKEMVGECPPLDSTHGEPWEFIINQWQRKQLEAIGAKVRVKEEIKQEENSKQTGYRLVREVDLKADGIESIIFGPKKDKSSALSEIIVGLKDEREGVIRVSLYDFNFNLIGEMRLHDVTFSRDLRYIGGIEYIEYPSVYREEKLLSGEIEVTEEKRIKYKFQLFDYTGKKLWEFKERQLHEVNCTYSISNRGTVIERDHGSGVVTFIDQQGNETNRIKICSSNGTPGSGIGGGIFSDDGEYALIVADESCPDTLEERMRVLFFSWDGKELWRSNTEEGSGGIASISKFGNYLIVSTRKTTYLFSQGGNLIKEYKNLFPTYISFSSDEKYFVITEYYHTAYLIRSEDGEIISKYGASKSSGSIYSSDVAVEAKAFGVLCSAEALLIGYDGSPLWSTDFPVPEGPLFRILNLSLSDDGKQIVIQVGTKIMIYQMIE